MIIFSRCLEKSDNSQQIVVLFGSGLVGGPIINCLIHNGQMSSKHMPTNWHILSQFIEHLHGIINDFQKIPISRLDWIWAAGQIGFNATSQQISEELAFFCAFLDIIDKSRATFKDTNIYFHLTSSAGGLFEGQRYVDSLSTPSPNRPYGVYKLRQEQLAIEYFGSKELYIYRLSSVYGFNNPRSRAGLISTLVSNTLCYRTTFFKGRLDTLRDYVWAYDVADFISNRVLSDSIDKSLIYLLASGHPKSIFEIQHLVQLVTRKRAYIHYNSEMSNSEHITFMPTALPNDWYSSHLLTNIRRIVIDAVCKGTVIISGEALIKPSKMR